MSQNQPLLSFTALDGSNSTGKTKFWLVNGITATDAMQGGDDIRSPLSALSSATFIRQSITYRNMLDNAPDPLSLSSVEYTCVLIFTTSTPGRYSMIDIPAIRSEMILQSGPNAGLVLDLNNPAVVSLVNTITTGFWCNPFGADILELAATIIERRKQ